MLKLDTYFTCKTILVSSHPCLSEGLLFVFHRRVPNAFLLRITGTDCTFRAHRPILHSHLNMKPFHMLWSILSRHMYFSWSCPPPLQVVRRGAEAERSAPLSGGTPPPSLAPRGVARRRPPPNGPHSPQFCSAAVGLGPYRPNKTGDWKAGYGTRAPLEL